MPPLARGRGGSGVPFFRQGRKEPLVITAGQVPDRDHRALRLPHAGRSRRELRGTGMHERASPKPERSHARLSRG
ncbi:MAG: hypothetical protein WCG80_05130 [Spirochaetales bacterium]